MLPSSVRAMQLQRHDDFTAKVGHVIVWEEFIYTEKDISNNLLWLNVSRSPRTISCQQFITALKKPLHRSGRILLLNKDYMMVDSV